MELIFRENDRNENTLIGLKQKLRSIGISDGSFFYGSIKKHWY